MTSFSSLRVRLVGTVMIAITPAWVLMYFINLPWTGFGVGLLALAAAWYGGERFILRQVRMLYLAAERLAAGDLGTRTGLAGERGELGQLARTFDAMAASIQRRIKEREGAEKALLNRSFQQTVLGALGQFALASNDFPSFLNQVVMLTAQTLEVEYCCILELLPDEHSMLLQAGVGWHSDAVGKDVLSAERGTLCGFTLTAGEPVVFEQLNDDHRFRASSLFLDHGVVSGVTVAITGYGRTFGILGAHTTNRRRFTEDEIHFLLRAATLVAMAVERHRAEAELQKLAAFAQLNPNPALELARDGTITYFNDAALKLSLSVEQAHPRGILPTNITEIVEGCLSSGRSLLRQETQLAGRTLSWSFHPVGTSRVVHCYVEDITERLSLEAQLRHSQKLDSIGQLAAGVAHDFNNMLAIIQGHAGMLMNKSNLQPELLESAQAVYSAAEHAANLTRQLLTFSRKNVMQLKLLDLREIVINISKLLQRLLGEPVWLEVQAPAELALVHTDGGMIEQVLMNLAVNARDAMPQGGKLIVRTGMTEIDDAYTHTSPESRCGSFVTLQVTDTGCGIDSATISRIFEPFFTTKEIGKGTGLGLATVYGIVKQHGGWVDVLSEVGKGTTFTVFLPAHPAPVRAAQAQDAPATEVRGGRETILVVEDEPVLRDMAHVILEDCGYRVLAAGSGVEALEVWNREPEMIDLLLTDMVMPEGISGMDLAQKLLAHRPKLKIIFATGYNVYEMDTALFRRGSAVFLQKPYTHVSLPKAVRECLDQQPN